MSCPNPDCVVHGQSEKAKAARAALQAVVVNQELLTLIRVLASNVHVELQAKLAQIGIPFPNSGVFHLEVIAGHHDRDDVVQGLINGFASLLRDVTAVQEMERICRETPSEQSYLKKVWAECEQQANEDLQRVFPGAPRQRFHDIEELLQFMKGHG